MTEIESNTQNMNHDDPDDGTQTRTQGADYAGFSEPLEFSMNRKGAEKHKYANQGSS